jgi:hypothetical protein
MVIWWYESRLIGDEWPQGGSSRSRWVVITMRTEPQGRKARLFTDITSTALGKKKWRYTYRLLETNSLKERSLWLICSRQNYEASTDSHC